MDVAITGSQNGEIYKGWDAVRQWTRQCGGLIGYIRRGTVHLDSRDGLEEIWRRARVERLSIAVVEPETPAQYIGEKRTGRLLAVFWP